MNQFTNPIQKMKQRYLERQIFILQSWKSDNYMGINSENLIVHQKLFRILGAQIIFSSTVNNPYHQLTLS